MYNNVVPTSTQLPSHVPVSIYRESEADSQAIDASTVADCIHLLAILDRLEAHRPGPTGSRPGGAGKFDLPSVELGLQQNEGTTVGQAKGLISDFLQRKGLCDCRAKDKSTLCYPVLLVDATAIQYLDHDQIRCGQFVTTAAESRARKIVSTAEAWNGIANTFPKHCRVVIATAYNVLCRGPSDENLS